MTKPGVLSVLLAAALAFPSIGCFAAASEDVVTLWKSVEAPPPPEVRAVTLSPATTALLLLDFVGATCNEKVRPRCLASVPKVAGLLRQARAKGVLVAYSVTRTTKSADILPELAARPDEPVVQSGVDKFLGTELEKILVAKGIKRVIVTGTAAHGAVLHTSVGAALRGFEVVLPVDGLSAESLYPEQYAVWHLLNSPGAKGKVTVTRLGMISFE